MSIHIIKEAEKLIKRYNTRNPFEIADALHIEVILWDLGKLKGFYKKDGHHRYILINENLDEPTKTIVCAHELGHDILHRHLAESKNGIQEFMLYDMTNKSEYEANLFAAELLLDDDTVFNLFKDHYDFFQAANYLYIDKNLLSIKLQSMNNRGYEFDVPIRYRPKFLK